MKRIIIFMLIAVLVVVGTYQAYNYIKVNDMLEEGKAYIEEHEFNRAIEIIESSMGIRETDEGIELLEYIEKITKSENSFARAMKSYENDNYELAWKTFNDVWSEDEINYRVAQEKLSEIEGVLSDKYLQLAQNEFNDENYIKAYGYLKSAVKFGSDEAEKLEKKYSSLSEWERLKQPTPKNVYNWIQERYDYYDEIEGKYTGEKYTDKIFGEAAEYFELSLKEVDDLYFKGAGY